MKHDADSKAGKSPLHRDGVGRIFLAHQPREPLRSHSTLTEDVQKPGLELKNSSQRIFGLMSVSRCCCHVPAMPMKTPPLGAFAGTPFARAPVSHLGVGKSACWLDIRGISLAQGLDAGATRMGPRQNEGRLGLKAGRAWVASVANTRAGSVTSTGPSIRATP